MNIKEAHRRKRGVSVRRLNYLMAIITLVISVLLLFATVRAHSGYNAMRRHTDEYIPVRGSNEFQFLAKTYNLMYEANREQKE